MPSLPVGKLRADMLQAVFDRYPPKDPRVVVGPRVGEDAAVLDAGDRYLVATTDPITFATDELAWYAVHVNANDVAVRGARPRWFLATLLLPAVGTSEEAVARLFDDLAAACRDVDVTLVGGHTEVTHGLDRPIVVGTMLGEVERERLVTTAGARVGDAVLFTKGIPLEGAAILAREKESELRAAGVERDVIARARRFLREPGIGVSRDAMVACTAARIHAMHDPTEGGLATALHELAGAAGVGVRVERERIPLLPEGAALCAALGLDPLGTIASGALLLTVHPADAAAVLRAWAAEGIAGHAIGTVTPPADGVVLAEDGRTRPVPQFPQDELTRLFQGG